MEASSEDVGWMKNTVTRLLARWVYPRATAVVGNSDAVVHELMQRFRVSPNHVQVIYNAANADQIRKLSEQKLADEASSQLPDSSSDTRFVAVGRLTFQKDYPTLLNAFKKTTSKLRATLTIVGDGPDREGLEMQTRELGLQELVSFVGEVQNPYPYIRCADALILSSRYEGLPNVLIEAQILGMPIVATDAPGGSREILLDGSAGLLVPVSDPAALADGMIDVITDKKSSELRVKNGIDALNRFDPLKCAAEYLNLVEASH